LSKLNPTYIRSVLQPTVYPLLCTCRKAVSWPFSQPEKAKLQVTHARVTTQRRFLIIFVVCGLGYGLGRIIERFYGSRFTLCAGLGRLHLSEYLDILATVMGDVCGQSLIILILQVSFTVTMHVLCRCWLNTPDCRRHWGAVVEDANPSAWTSRRP
jgi:hypothetical protein